MTADHASADHDVAAAGPPPKWDARQIPSQTGKLAIVTGANSGIGYVTARELARKGAHVVLACRNETRGLEAEQRIRDELAQDEDAASGGRVEFMQLDVSDLASVHSFAQRFTGKFDRLNLLVNNAGIMAVPYAETVDGYESQFATNHLGPFALTASLFQLLKQGAPSRVVNVSSVTHKIARLDPDELMTPKDKYWAMVVYGNSKLCNLLFTLELSRRLKAQGIDGVRSVACHPGYSSTNLLGPPGQTRGNIFSRLFWGLAAHDPIAAQSADMGALPTLYAATAPGVVSGQFFGPSGFMTLWGHPALEIPVNQSHSEDAADKLWTLSERLAKLSFTL